MKTTRYSCQILTKLEFSGQIFETYASVMKMCPVGAELFCADRQIDRQTDMTMLIVAVRNFANAAKMYCDPDFHAVNTKSRENVSSGLNALKAANSDTGG